MARLAIIVVFLYQVSFLLHMEAHEHEADHGTESCAACTQYEENEFEVAPARSDATNNKPAALAVVVLAPQVSGHFLPAYRTRAPPHV
ncbi:MAG: hypothetical protein AAF351_14820 [Pseudomonadota bacterium]